jgi:diguanylate cyclase (GGDEF)-like protein
MISRIVLDNFDSSIPMPNGLVSAVIRKLPLRFILVVPFVVHILAVGGVIGWLAFRNGQQAVNDLAAEWHAEMMAHIEQQLNEPLAAAVLVTQINADALVSERLNFKDNQAMADYLSDQLQQFPGLSNIAIATETLHYIGITQADVGTQPLQPGNTHSSDTTPPLDPRQLPGYQSARLAGQSIWQFYHQTNQAHPVVLSLHRPVYDKNGQLLGVTEAALNLDKLSNLLSRLKISRNGQVFVINRNGTVVATSTPVPPLPGNDPPDSLKVQSRDHPLIHETTRLLTQTYQSLSQIQTPQQLRLAVNRQPHYVQVTPFTRQPGLDWLMVITMPESDLMATIHRQTQTTLMLCGIALAFTTGLGILTARLIVHPIISITKAADALSQGRWQNLMVDSPISDLMRLTQAFNRMANQLHTSFNTLAYNAQHDTLTGLLNRGALQARLEIAIEQRHQKKFALFFLDLDDFKLVNDSCGHIVGDQLLIAIANRLQTTLKVLAKTVECITFARFGGDEFVILLEPITDNTAAMQVANTLLQVFTPSFHLKGHEIYISTSIGIVLSTLQGSRPEEYLRNADIALYAAKRNGKASYELFDTRMHTLAVERLALETDLRKAIKQAELVVYYQPIINCQTLRIEGFEALLRWHHPLRGLISPVEFIPIAEQSGLILDLGWWTLRQACTQMKLWQGQFAHCQNMVMNINLSTKQFSQPDCLDIIAQILAETALSAQNVKLEITESIFLNCGEDTESKLQWLQEQYIRLSIDDFGTGYSSLSYLYRFPVNTLKIDRSFIHRLMAYYSSKPIVEAILALGHKLDLDLVAEGVETVEELQWLQTHGCEYVQGFLLAPPAPAKDITTLLSSGIGYTANPLPSPSSLHTN